MDLDNEAIKQKLAGLVSEHRDRIGLLRCLECPYCSTVIKAEEKVESLVEVFLRFGRVC